MPTFFSIVDSLQAPKFGSYCVITENLKWQEQFSITANISSLKAIPGKFFI